MTDNSQVTPIVSAEDVRLSVVDQPDILAGIDLEIRDGEFIAVVGPSGCGKTTFLNMISGLQSFTGGSLRVRGETPYAGHPEMAYALARDALLPWRTALGNVELGLQIRGIGKAERRERAQAMLEQVGLGKFLNSHPVQLSQGMRQRVALARTFVTQPRMLILDEPFAALDAQTRIKMQELLLGLLRKYSGTMVIVTHDIAEAITLADRIVVFSTRPAKVSNIYESGLRRQFDSIADIRGSQQFSHLFELIWGEIEKGFEL